MFKNHIKIAWRNLWKIKSYSIINIIGLCIGMTAVLIIGIWVQNQLQFDNFYSDKENIYKVLNKNRNDEGKISLQEYTSGQASPALIADYPKLSVQHASIGALASYSLLETKKSNPKATKSIRHLFRCLILNF
ncbi:hypothetical protein KUH03_11970 [Sphingobacterium sp. E70]|uniref:ABC transporter permease n=1 Tax=Sphingobacterium sp. E70 TaxID=2853439 RepID=UPI00211C3A01|nr:ABC transporter permease [Sphingobacterium sp. E70]ULT27395.1 hypothetical protein KUH03_11970 [Sphingobacterium sp. E70]